MKIPRLLSTLFALGLFASAAFAADPAGIWKWSVTTPNGAIETTLKLTLKDGQLTGTYSNSFGDTAITGGTFKGDAIAFDVEREFGGNKFVLKYRGKLAGDAIKGTIGVPGPNGDEARQLDWSAKRTDAPAAKKS